MSGVRGGRGTHAQRAVSDLAAVAPYEPGRPCEIKVGYKNPNAAHSLRHRAGVELLPPRTTLSCADTWRDVWKQLYF